MPYTPPPDYIPPPDAKASAYIPPPDYIEPPDAAGASPRRVPIGTIRESDGSLSVVPSLDAEGHQLSDEDTILQYEKTGNRFGNYPNIEAAKIGARAILAKQATAPMMPSHGPTTVPTPTTKPNMLYIPGQAAPMPIGNEKWKQYAAAILNPLGQVPAETVHALSGAVQGVHAFAQKHPIVSQVAAEMFPGTAGFLSPAAQAIQDKTGAITGAQGAGQMAGEVSSELEPSQTGPKIANFIAKMPLEMGKFIAAGPGAPLVMGIEGYGNTYLAAKAKGASDDKAQAAAATAGGVNTAFGMVPEIGPKAQSLAQLFFQKTARGFVLGTGMEGGNLAAQWIYDPEGAKAAAKDPNTWIQAVGTMLPYELAGGVHQIPEVRARAAEAKTPIIEHAAPEAPPERTPDMIRQEALVALRRGDVAKASALRDELAQATAPKPVEPTAQQPLQKIELDPLRRYGKIDLDVPDIAAGDVTPPQEAVPPTEPAAPPSQPVRRYGVEAGLGEQEATVDALNQRRQQLLSDIQSADEQAQQAGRKRGPEGRRLAQKTAEGLRQELADVEGRITENTGKSPEEMGWSNTKQAWDNLKDEMKKPGGQRGAIGPNVDQMGGADIPGKVAELVAAGMKDGHRNASEWLASMRDKMEPEDFDALYRAVGGVKGASAQWQNNERSSAMLDKPFTSRETGETFPLQTEVNGDQVTTVGNRKGIAPADRPSATISINQDGSLHLDGIDNKGVTGTGNEMFRKTVLAALNNGGDESGVIHAEATPEAREMLSRYKGFKDDGRIVEVPTDSVLGNKQNPEKMKFASAGLNPFEAVRDAAEAAKKELGLPEGATDADLGREVMNRIGRLGSSVKETVVRIMSKIKGIGRDMAQALAEHFHQAVSGTRESQLGAIGKDIKPKARDFLTPEQIEAEKADRAKYKDLLQTLIPGDTPEAKSERAAMWKNYEAPWKRELPQEEAASKPSLPYRPTTRAREGSIPDAINQFLDQTLRRAFPSAVDQAGARAGDISRYRESEAATAVFKVNRNIRNALVKMSMAKPEIREMVADAIESPSGKYKINDAKLAKAVDFVKEQSKAMGEELVKAGAIKSYIENYLRHAFKESPEQIEMAIKKKSPTGNLSYLIERHGPDTYAIAKELGLTPKNTNPFQTFFDDFVNKQKFLVAHKTISDLMGEGLVTKDAQPGYVKLNDYLRNAVSKSKAGEAGEYYAPKSVADLLNNHLGEGFERNAGFRAIRAFNNSMNHVQLGLSFFHGMFIMRDMANTMLGSGITAMARGDFKEGARQLALGASPIYGQKVMASSGSEMRSMMAGETPTTPEMQQVIHAYQLGGGHPELSPEYINDSMLKMRESWAKAKDVKLDAASRAYWGVKTVGEIPFSALEQFAKPVMEHLVPNAKAGAFRELWKVESKRLPPDATDAQKAIVARKLVNDIDDRMGQLIYNNLHLPNAMRQAITLTIRAGGWDIGSLRAIYGSGIDFAKAGKMLAQDVAAKAGAIKPETLEAIKAKREAQGVFGPKSYMTQRMGYGVASALSMAVTNGLITYVGNRIRNATKGPGEKDTETMPTGMDYVFPRIGKDRYSVAGYEKEAVEQYHILKNVLLHHDLSAITNYVSQKASPVVNLAKMWGSGYDWKGNRIGKLSALAQQYSPMVVKDMGSPELPTSSAAIGRLGGPSSLQNGGRFVGITPAPKKLIQTDAENKALDILHQDKTPLSEQAADHADFVNRMALYYKNGDMEVYNDAKNKGLLTPQDINKIKMKAREHDLLTGVVGSRSVSPEDALDIYKNYATPDEQKKLKTIMLKKKMMARRSTPPANMEQWRKDWSVVK